MCACACVCMHDHVFLFSFLYAHIPHMHTRSYGWAMKTCLPYAEIRFCTGKHFQALVEEFTKHLGQNIPDDGDVGYVLEVKREREREREREVKLLCSLGKIIVNHAGVSTLSRRYEELFCPIPAIVSKKGR